MEHEDLEDLPEEELVEYPLLPLRDTVMFPHMVTPLLVARPRSVKAVEAAVAAGLPVVGVTQRNGEVEEPNFVDLYTHGTEIEIQRMLRMPDGSLSILGQGRRRVKLIRLSQLEPYGVAQAQPVAEPSDDSLTSKALRRAVLALFEKAVQLSRNLSTDAYVAALNVEEPGRLADLIASLLELGVEERQEILSTEDPALRLQRLNVMLAKEIEVLQLESDIQNQVQQEIDKSQREYFLREQMRIIQEELGEVDTQAQEVNGLKEKIAQAGMTEEARAKAEQELRRLELTPSTSPETTVIRTYLDWLVALPWKEVSQENVDLPVVARLLEESHYGLEKAKERILEHIAVRKLAGDKMRTPILCFLGPPGTGKTSMGRSIARALSRQFVRVSLGGIRDEAEIRGHRRTYVGALPGRVIQTMRRARTINPVFMLDEVDKIGLDFRGDPAAALLEVLDPEQNYAFSDHYLDVPYDLSKVMFITTANLLEPVSPTLQDRMEVIEFPGYTEDEKLEIAKRFLVPRLIEEHGLKDGPKLSDSTLLRIIREYTSEAGVRNLERELAKICRKVAQLIAEGKPAPQRITRQALTRYLGPPRYAYGVAEEQDEVGVATGVAWTEFGGDLISVEVTLMEGKGSLILTGQMGEVMQESAQAALSYARAHAKALGVKVRDFDKVDIHIHIPEGGIPKDGPSGGVTIATALVSALSNRPVRRDVAMTGEITLRGRILPVGALKEKVLAAHRAGLKTLILPRKNHKDLAEIPLRERRGLEFAFVGRMEEVLLAALVPDGTTDARGAPGSEIVSPEPDTGA